MGALASGTAAAVSTGAFSAMTADRDANINVVNDSDGLLALRVDHDSETVRKDGGELTIDMTAGGEAGGVNVNSKYQIGALLAEDNVVDEEKIDGNSPTVNSAFIVANQDTEPKEVTLSYELNNPESVVKDGSKLVFETRARPDQGQSDEGDGSWDAGDGGSTMQIDAAKPSNSITKDGDRTLFSGGGFGVSLLIDTTGENANVEEDLSGTLTVSANE